MTDPRPPHYVRSFGRSPQIGSLHVYDNGLWNKEPEYPSLSFTFSLDGGRESSAAATIEGEELYELGQIISNAIQRHEDRKEASRRCCDSGCGACDGGIFKGAPRAFLAEPETVGAPDGYVQCSDADLEEWAEVTWFAKRVHSNGTLHINPCVKDSDV